VGGKGVPQIMPRDVGAEARVFIRSKDLSQRKIPSVGRAGAGARVIHERIRTHDKALDSIDIGPGPRRRRRGVAGTQIGTTTRLSEQPSKNATPQASIPTAGHRQQLSST